MKFDPHCSAVEPLHRLCLCNKADPTSHRALPAQCLWVLPKFMQGHAMGHWNATLAPSCATSKASQIQHRQSNAASCRFLLLHLLVLVPGNSTAHPLRTLLATPWDKTSQAPSNPASKASLLSSFSIAPVSKTSLKKCLRRSTCSARFPQPNPVQALPRLRMLRIHRQTHHAWPANKSSGSFSWCTMAIDWLRR